MECATPRAGAVPPHLVVADPDGVAGPGLDVTRALATIKEPLDAVRSLALAGGQAARSSGSASAGPAAHTRSRPVVFAVYSARSAAANSLSKSNDSPGRVAATPIDIVTSRPWIGSVETAWRRRSAVATASRSLAPGSRIANSSPPKR